MKIHLLTVALFFGLVFSLQADWQAGLRAGAVRGYQNYADLPEASYVKSGPHIGTNRNAVLVPLDTTWAYTGQIKLNGGPYVFGCAMDAHVYLRINGEVKFNQVYGNNLSSVIELPAGWYDFDLRLSHQIYHNGLPSGANNWPLNLGFGMTTNRNATKSGVYFSYPQDPGDMSLFRCATDNLVPAANALLVRGDNGYDDTPNLPAPYLISPLIPGDVRNLVAPTNHISTVTALNTRCIGYDLLTNGVLKASGTSTNLTYTHTADLPELVWKWRREFLTIAWTNAAGGAFHTPGNWSPSLMPDASDIAVFNLTNQPYTVTWNGTATNKAVNVQAGTITWVLNGFGYYHGPAGTYLGMAESPIDLTITNGTFVALAGYVAPLGIIQGSNTMVRLYKTTFKMAYPGMGRFTTLIAYAGSSWSSRMDGGIGVGATMIFTNGALIASSRMALSAGASVTVAGSTASSLGIAQGFAAGSEVNLLQGARVGQDYPDSSKQTAVQGTMTLASNACYYAIYPNLGQNFAILPGGIVRGDGRFENFTNFWNSGGQIWPGGSNGIGRLTVKGTNTFDSGTLVIELAGTNACDQFFTEDRIFSIGGGTLSVRLINGFTPAYKDRFKILNFPGISGAFNVLDLELGKLKWNTDDLYITGEIQFLPLVGTMIQIR